MNGLTVSVYRDADGSDCTMNGVTSQYRRLILVGPGIEGPDNVPDDRWRDVIELQVRDLSHFGDKYGGRYMHATPRVEPGTPRPWFMHGGNFVHTSDSRFPAAYPIAVHDRVESAQQSEVLSR